MPPRRFRGLDANVITAYEELAKAAEAFQAPDIRRALENREDLKDRKLPDERAIQRDLKSRRAKDLSRPWSLADATPEETAAVLPVLAVVIKMTQGRRKHLTLDEVEWIKKIRAAVPEFEPWDIYVRALQYRRAKQHKDEKLLRQLDAELAIRPWESADQASVWAQAFGTTSKGPTGGFTVSDFAIPRHAQESHEESDRQKQKGGTGNGKKSTR